MLGSNNEVKNLGRQFCANNSIACEIKGRFRKGFLRILVCLLLALFLSINRKHCLDLKRGSQHRLLCDQCHFSKLLWDNMTARYSNCNDRPSSGTILTPISDISCPGAFAVQLCELGLLRLEQRRRPARQGHQAHHRRRQQGIRPRRGKCATATDRRCTACP